jgi:transcription initiation factor TFIID TATA-box-binding protein
MAYGGHGLVMCEEEIVGDPKETLEIQNVVASTEIEQELDLQALAKDLDQADHDPEQFPGVVYRPAEHRATALIFRSGKIICLGAGSVEGICEAAHAITDDLRGLGISVNESPDITVQNIVMSGVLGERLNLAAIAIGLGLTNVEYEPEQFPGLVYRLDDPDVVMLLFGSGKIVIVGGTVPEDGEAAVETIRSRLTDLTLLG